MKLSNDSKKIIQFIRKTEIKVNKRSVNMREIFDDIKEAYEFVKSTQLHVHKTVTQIQNISEASRIMTPDHFGSAFIDNSIHSKIMDSIQFSIKYTFRMFDRDYNVVFNICDVTDFQKSDTMFEIVIQWLYIVGLYSPSKCSSKIDIYLFLCDVKKKMPKETIDVIGKPHVNSAYTYCCQTNNQIIVYRKEEWFKVFIHETMHSFGLDFCGSRINTTVSNYLKPTFNIESNMSIYEAYCESWAVIMNIAVSIFNKLPSIKYSDFSKQIRHKMNIEIGFSIFQMNKILDHMGIEYSDLYTQNSTASIKRHLYKEDSEVFSYFVVKTIIIFHYNLFILWCESHNHSLLNFNASDRNIIEFCKFILSLHKKTGIIGSIDKMNAYMKNINDNTFIMKTARMTAHDYES
jgi:predicted Zn-dependent protease with MMP-like domain